MRCKCGKKAEGTMVTTAHGGSVLTVDPFCAACAAQEEGEHPGSYNGYCSRWSVFVPRQLFRTPGAAEDYKHRVLMEDDDDDAVIW